MNNLIIYPPPQSMNGFAWRPVNHDDKTALVELAGLCYQSDGGLNFLYTPEEITQRFFPDEPGASIGAMDSGGQLVACSRVGLTGEASKPRATIIGHVHPDKRGRGLGRTLMHWSQVQAGSLLADAAGARLLQIRTESLTDPADRLYRAFAFECVFNELVMAYDLHMPVPGRLLPPETRLASWQPELAGQFYQAYYNAFRERPGFPGWSAAEWIGQVTENDLVPEWTLLASEDGTPLGFVIGNIDLTKTPPNGYIWQIGVVPEARRRGLASALLTETMRRMRASGAASATLCVHTNNPGAIQAYADLGFETVGRRARYERIVN